MEFEKTFLYESIEEIMEQGHALDMILECEFETVNNKNGTISLADLQGADLGGICSEEFETYEEILYRLEGSYLNDYGIVEFKGY